MNMITSILEVCDEHNVVKIFYENNKESSVDDIKTFLKEHDLTEEDFLNVLNETTVLNSSNTELFIKLAKFIHKCGIKEQVLLNCIHEPYSRNVLDKLPENAFNQEFLCEECFRENLIESLKKEACFGIFEYFFHRRKYENHFDIRPLFTSHLKYLQYVERTKRFCFDERIFCFAAENGNLECLKYLKEKGCPWNRWTCKYAAENGHLECLKYLKEIGCPWNEFTCAFAAFNGHLDCLKYAHENGCPWDEDTCRFAAQNGHLECLKYAREKGCKWDEFVCHYAAHGGHLGCLKYAHENGCPWDKWVIKYSCWYNNLDCLKYACENECPTS